ncbi:iron-containing alcohol dehydrogenase family protein [Halorubrum sp. DTA98]|uniref:iron-containing alcohol dehydrogenase family protein n=1 Tax=Halorubrum sp. DTA98 TaxID=3402163 RepID=UPI003AAD6EE1
MADALTTTPFDHEYRGCDVLYGRGRIGDLEAYLGEAGLERALVVCGSNVGANETLMGSVREGLGERFVGVFDGTTPDKLVDSVYDLLDAVAETDADVLVGVGGGSSLDIARQASVLAADGRSLSDLRATAAAEGRVEQPSGADPELPVVVVPTTFAGADLSDGGTLVVTPVEESPTDQPVLISGSAMPIADVVDPSLFETTPRGALAGSAMNGFNKGIETPYARDASAISDATAIHGLRYFGEALPRVAGDDDAVADADPAAMDRAALGALLVQVDRKVSVIHAFGHGFSRRYDVQQGDVHAVLAPPVLRYVFGSVDGNRRALAAGLGVDVEGHSDDEIADRVVDAVAAVRDGMNRPDRARDLPETSEEDVPEIAAFILDDPMMARAPSGLDPTVEEIESVLREAW